MVVSNPTLLVPNPPIPHSEMGHGNKFKRISSSFNFEWTKFEFSKIRNKFESLCSNFELSIKRASDISPFHLVPLMFPSC